MNGESLLFKQIKYFAVREKLGWVCVFVADVVVFGQ